MNIIKTYIVQFILSIAFVFVMLFFFNSQSAPTLDQDIIDFNDDWIISINNESTVYEILPSKVDSETMSEVTLEKVLPTGIESGDAIIFFTAHHEIRVLIDNTMVYEFTMGDNHNSKTPGNAWHIIRLETGDSGKSIKIIGTPSYKSMTGYIPTIQYGKSDALIGQALRSGSLSLVFSIILFIIGIFGIIGAIFFHKKLEVVRSLIWIGLFSLAVGMWSLADIGILQIFLGHHLLFNQISLIFLKLLLIPVVIYVQSIYELKDNKFIKLICGLSIADFFVTGGLQVFGVLDLKETLVFTHLLMIITAVAVIITNIKKLLIGREKFRKTVQAHLISMVFLSFFVCLDLFRYIILYEKDSGKFTKLGLLGYILILLYLAVNNSIKLIHSREQLDSIKEYSKRDAITQLGNRVSFQEELDSIFNSKEYSQYSIAIFDLNNLKEFNDHYGHSTGDYYIIISSEIIQDLFGKYGKVYRIGGDEFCAILKNMSYTEFINLEEKMSKRMEELKGIFFEMRMSIAAGYASFDYKKDLSINDTLQRADENMYERKKRMKNASKSFLAEAVQKSVL